VSLLLAGCGDSRTSVPDLSAPAAPVAFRTAHFPTAGITLQIPRTWVVIPGHGALVSTVSSRTAIVARAVFGRLESSLLLTAATTA
jgi:hypothetical protein